MSNAPNFHVVLHQPEIPHNTGNVGRTCVAIGAKLWLVRPLGFRMDNHYLKRAGLDYWDHLDWTVKDDWDSLRQATATRPYWLFSKTAEREYTSARFTPDDLLVFGSETQGLPRSLLAENADRSLRIPIRPEVRSLNLASAVAIVLYEALRQQGS
ncbi:MAG: tRNA (cytidine(34)-2'-O)-methyltransferase [Pirellulaceae bacterium]|nr:tRNA (cytidine(34)-2'-O)-methyltransferase [Pirellulaceae bacterium]